VTIIEKKFQLAGREITLETGRLARQAHGAVVLKTGTLMLLATVVVRADSPPASFLPLSVHFQSKAYAFGRIPGGFKRREGPPNESEILISRLIDRPLRPLFPSWFTKEVQIVVSQLSADESVESDTMAIIAAAAAMLLARLPITEIVGGVRIGYGEQGLVVNPTLSNAGKLDLVVAGNGRSIFMVESVAKEVSEEILVEALELAQKELASVEVALNDFAALAALSQESDTTLTEEPAPSPIREAITSVLATEEEKYWANLVAQKSSKSGRQVALKAIKADIVERCVAQLGEAFAEQDGPAIVSQEIDWMIERKTYATRSRLDGRKSDEIRPIKIETSLLPMSHGSALFTRGSTQSLTSVVLGTSKDAQLPDSYDPRDGKDGFMLHYNFPQFSVGELGPIGSPKRREIGHGRLARRAIEGMLPAAAEFPYVLRVVSEILESDGSSSMATVCASSLALMDAGVPMKRAVAGIAMGLIPGDNPMILSDICGEEDAVGGMDFKVAGTADGVTALQMDIKVPGIRAEIMNKALYQARLGRMQILEQMNRAISQARSEIANHAPRLDVMRIRPDQVRDVIGKGGSTIKMITEQSGATLELADDGVLTITSYHAEAAQKAKDLVLQITEPLTIGQSYDAQVVKMLDFGFVVATANGKDGLVHISECPFPSSELASRIALGQKMRVTLTQIDKANNRYKFSLLPQQPNL